MNATSNTQSRQVEDNGTTRDPRPLGGYAVLLGAYATLASATLFALRGRANRVREIDVRTLFLGAIATEHLSRLIAKDSITAVLRAPFTEFVEATGEGEVKERVVGTGLRHAIGELLTCPFCLAQWVGTALVAGSVAVPNLTSAVITISALARCADVVQIGYDRLKRSV
jgi:hypothetical protein